MSLWQFTAAIGGVAKANGGGGDERLNREEADGLASFLKENR